MSGSTISGTVIVGVTVNSADDNTPFLITSSGTIRPADYGVSGVSLENGVVTNLGTVGGGGNFQGPAGVGVDIIGDGTLYNGGVLLGGSGLLSTGAGLNILQGDAENSGTISGSEGLRFPDPPNIYGLAGGIGVTMYGGSLTNDVGGVITGGQGGAGLRGAGVGGYGVYISGGSFVNAGSVAGGIAGTSGAEIGPGGSAVKMTGGTFINTGTIGGGSGGPGGYDSLRGIGYNSGSGLVLDGGSVFNEGLIAGGNGSSDFSNAGVRLDGGTLVDDGAIAGGIDPNGVQQDAVKFGGVAATMVVEPGAIFYGSVAANFSVLDELQLSAGTSLTTGLLDMGTSFSGFSKIVFDAGTLWKLEGTTSDLAYGQTIEGFSAGDLIKLEDFTATSETYVDGVGLQLSNGSIIRTLDITGSLSTGSFIMISSSAGTEIELDTPICYLHGTKILTPVGDVPIEELRIGDAVITRFSGYRPIKWIGRQSYGARFIRGNRDQIPVCIAAGALGFHQPARDLSVSPGHAILLNDVLVLARDLVNGVTITQHDLPDEVHYYQIEFETHDCLLAEGIWSESFCDYAGLRNRFHNAAAFWSLYPDHLTPNEHRMCAPRPEGGEKLEDAIRQSTLLATTLARPGELQGWVDEISTNGVIRGWARDLANPDLPVTLEAVVDKLQLSTTIAFEIRPDLVALGAGRSRLGFLFRGLRFPSRSIPAIQVRRTVDGSDLPIAPHCSANILGARERRKREIGGR